MDGRSRTGRTHPPADTAPAGPLQEAPQRARISHADLVIDRFVRLARNLPPRWWVAYGVYAVVAVVATYLWSPGMLPFIIVWVIVSIAVAVASPAKPPTRHRRKQADTKHLAE
jgi:hypothetical protein